MKPSLSLTAPQSQQGDAMFTVDLSVPLNEDEAWVHRTIELPFAPYKGLFLGFCADSTSCIFDEVTADTVEWNVPLQRFDVICRFERGFHSIEVAREEMKARGWVPEEHWRRP